MTFEQNVFSEYKKIIETTAIQKCYHQVIQLIKYVSSELENKMPEYTFMGRIVENHMDFSYFQITREGLKEQGLKIQIVFIHATCEFEVWISGYNREIQCNYYKKLCDSECPFQICSDPQKNDFIIKTVIKNKITASKPEAIIAEIKITILELEKYIQNIQKENWN